MRSTEQPALFQEISDKKSPGSSPGLFCKSKGGYSTRMMPFMMMP